MQTSMCDGARQRAWGAWKSRIRFNCARCSWPSTVTYMIGAMCVGLLRYPSANCWMADQSPVTDGCRCGNDERSTWTQAYRVLARHDCYHSADRSSRYPAARCLNPNGFPSHFLAVLAGIVALVAAPAPVPGLPPRGPRGHSGKGLT